MVEYCKVTLLVCNQQVVVSFWLYRTLDLSLGEKLEADGIATIKDHNTLNRVISAIVEDAQFNSSYDEYVKQCAQLIELLKSQQLPITIKVLD